MKKYYLQAQIYPLLLLLVGVASCNGQVNTNPPKTITYGQPKIIKTQGTGLYDNVHCGLQDKAGNLWFGTTGEGVYRYDGKSFINFTEKDGLNSNDVWCIYEDRDGNLWFGTGNGVCRYSSSASPGGKPGFIPLPMPGALDFNFKPYNPSNNNPSKKKSVMSILQDKTGNFWFGTDEGVFRYNMSADKAGGKSMPGGLAGFTHFYYNDSVVKNSGVRLGFINSLLEDKAGNIWFASWEREGVCRYDGKSITRFTPNGDDMVYSILEDKSGNIWFGTRNHGACRYDPATGGFTNFADIKIFSSSCVYSMAKDKAGNIWFGTELGSGGAGTLGGVWRYDPSAAVRTGSKSFTNFTSKDGLSHNSVFSVTIDKSGKLWFGTRGTGLCSYDGKTFTNFSE